MRLFIPTPSTSVLELGSLTIHFYALAILLGIISALLIARNQYSRSGGDKEEISDLALWTILAGIVGGRLYHVITSPDAYFGTGGRPLNALKIWEGGMGIWGAVALGGAVAYFLFRSKPRSRSFAILADALAPALLVAQGIGRWGNWFNGELFGSPTTLPWGLEIPLGSRPVGYETFATFHPTFLYESLWCFAGALILLKVPLFQRLRPGYRFVAYIAIYTLGRTWIEALRIDDAHHIFGLRLNLWVSGTLLVISVGALIRRGLGHSPVLDKNGEVDSST